MLGEPQVFCKYVLICQLSYFGNYDLQFIYRTWYLLNLQSSDRLLYSNPDLQFRVHPKTVHLSFLESGRPFCSGLHDHRSP